VIEDALPGINAGLAAKMKVIAVDKINKISESKLYTRITTLKDLEKYI